MTADALLAALDLPASTRVGHRVPKSMLLEHGAATPADKRCINEGIDSLHWVATLKPTTIGVQAFADDTREYLEIAVLSAVLKPGAKVDQLIKLIHRPVPYPVVLLMSEEQCLRISVAHKRWSRAEARTMVLEEDRVEATLDDTVPQPVHEDFLAALSLTRQPRTDLYRLYQGWADTLLALNAARLTGRFVAATSAERAAQRRDALQESARLYGEINRLRAAAEKERQMARRVELNLKLKRAEAARAEALAKL